MTLDPSDWDDLKKQTELALDAAIAHLQNAGDGRVWTPFPDHLKSALNFELPANGMALKDVRQALEQFMPYGVGNTHPRFFGWVHGTGDPNGLLAEIIAAAMNANCGGRDHVGLYIERQIVEWLRGLMGFPENASGLLVTGTSMATLVALKIARDKAYLFQRRKDGNSERLMAYAAEGAHSCVVKAMDVMGFGTDAVRHVPVTADGKMDVTILQDMINFDNEAGLKPFAVIGTAGGVNTGYIDDLAAIATVAKKNGIWFHVDGAFGATAILVPEIKERLKGLELADSIAFDFHKWWHVNYDAGCVLVRDRDEHLKSWSERPEYLAAGEALAGGNPWPTDFGLDLSRGFRALKVWAHLLIHGTDALAEGMARNIAQVQQLAQSVKEIEDFELAFEPQMNVICFRLKADGLDLDAFNEAVVAEVQMSGVAAPSTTRIDGKLMIRVNITNHRTQDEDLDLLLDAILAAGEKLYKDYLLS